MYLNYPISQMVTSASRSPCRVATDFPKATKFGLCSSLHRACLRFFCYRLLVSRCQQISFAVEYQGRVSRRHKNLHRKNVCVPKPRICHFADIALKFDRLHHSANADSDANFQSHEKYNIESVNFKIL